MIKPIVTDTTELKKPCETITSKEELDLIIKDLEDTLADNGNGIGLASNQIGYNKQVAIIRIGKDKIDLINPIILEKLGKFRMEKEGCLSFPGLYIDTLRYSEIWVETGLEKREKIVLRGIYAVAGLHEIQHLQGKTLLESKWRTR